MYASLRLIALTFTIFLWLLIADAEIRFIESERHALLNFKQHLIDPSDCLASWYWAAADMDCCHWVGFVCHNVTGHVLQLRLWSFFPVGDEFSTDDLESLHLYKNKFSGKLLSLLKYCKDLLTIDIGENEFVGSIPKWIGHRLSSLMILSLHSNNFYGQISDEICDHINQYFDDFYMIFDLVNTSNQANCTFVHRSPIWVLRN